ncbi:MAG: putative metal-binding motif-containing protein, partial [Planctomycetota bacterium]
MLSRATLLAAIATGCFAASAQSQSIVDLRLVGPATPIIPGQIFDVKLRAAPQNPTLAASFVAIDCIVGWNPAQVKFLSISTTGSVPLSSSYLPSPAVDYTGINEANPPADGNLLYYALTSLGNPRAVPAAGVQVVTFRFQSVGLFTSTSISVIDNLTAIYPTETIVYDGVVPGVDDFGIGYAATVTQLDCSTIFWYRDSDGDGAGDPSDSTTSCTQPAGYVSSSNDLCPTNAAMLAPITYYIDADQDGFGAAGSPNAVCQTTAPAGSVTNSTDCNDALVMYNDSDADGYGTAIKVACNGATLNTDCNDAVAAINPGRTEICDLANTDENCNGLADNADSGAADAGKSNFY